MSISRKCLLQSIFSHLLFFAYVLNRKNSLLHFQILPVRQYSPTPNYVLQPQLTLTRTSLFKSIFASFLGEYKHNPCSQNENFHSDCNSHCFERHILMYRCGPNCVRHCELMLSVYLRAHHACTSTHVALARDM